MLLSEAKLRSIVRDLILESFLSKKTDSLNSIQIDGLGTFKAVGYSLLGKEHSTYSFGDLMNKMLNIDSMFETVVFQIPKDHAILASIKKGPFILLEGDVKVRNHGTQSIINTDIYNKNSKSKTRMVALPIDENSRKQHGLKIKFSSEKWDSGAPADVDMVIETLGLIGLLPFLGEPADIATMILALKKEEPDYLLAALSLLCALPVLGYAAAGAKKSIKETGNIDEAAELLAAALPSSASVVASRNQYNKIVPYLDEHIEEIARATDIDAVELSNHIEKVDEICKKIFDKMEEMSPHAKSRPGSVKLLKANFRKELAKAIESLKSGSQNARIRKSIAKVQTKSLEKTKIRMKQVLDDLIDSFDPKIDPKTGLRPDGTIPKGIYEAADRFLIEFEGVFAGKSIPNRPGETFQGGAQLWNNISRATGKDKIAARKIYADIIFEMYKRNVKDVNSYTKEVEERIMTDVTQENIDKMISNVVESFGNIKLKYTDDPLTLKTPTNTNATAESLLDLGGYMSHPLNITKMKDGMIEISDQEMFVNLNRVYTNPHAMAGTIEHELGHHIQHTLLPSMGLGNEFVSRAVGEYFTDFGKFLSKEKESLFSISAKDGRVITVDNASMSGGGNLQPSAEMLNSAIRENFRVLQRFMGKPELNIPNERYEFAKRLKSNVGIELPKPHLDYVLYVLRDAKGTPYSSYPGGPMDKTLYYNHLGYNGRVVISLKSGKQIDLYEELSYHSTPEEAGARFYTLANTAKEMGYNTAVPEELTAFFKNETLVTIANHRGGIQRADMTHFYEYCFEIAKSSRPGDPEVFKDLMVYITTFM